MYLQNDYHSTMNMELIRQIRQSSIYYIQTTKQTALIKAGFQERNPAYSSHNLKGLIWQ